MTPRFAMGLLTGLLLTACRGDNGVPAGDSDDPATMTDDAGDAGEEGDSSGESGGPSGEPDPDDEYEYLTPVEHLTRVSMALRGQRPAPADVERVREDPEAVGELVDEYMQGAGFGEVVRDLHNDAILTEIGYPTPAVGPLEGIFAGEISRSVAQMPLRLVEHVIMEDRPYSEIVTADYWLANEHASVVYGLDYNDDGPAWQTVPIPGQRPAAGILSDNTFFLRHESAGANYNRGRANAVSKALLCQDFLALDINVSGEVDLSDPDDVANAVQTDPACIACHDHLDPIASHFFGYPGTINAQQLAGYGYPLPDLWQPQLVETWMTTTQRSPGFFGTSSGGLGELGQLIADDPRFASCAAKRFYAYFHQVRVEDVSNDDIEPLEGAFVDSGLDARTLMREIMLSDAFRRAAAKDEGVADDVRGYKKARPFQLALLMEDLTGFDWSLRVELEDPDAGVGSVSVLRDARLGLGVLGGGLDSEYITEPSLTVNATTVLTLRELAREAASFVVEEDRSGGDARLLTSVGNNETGEAAIRAQLVELAERLYAQTHDPEDDDIDLLWAIFAGALEDGADVEHAWKATLTAMLSDLSIIYY